MGPNLRIMVNKPLRGGRESRHALAVLDLDNPQVRIEADAALEQRHGNPMGWAHGGLLVTVADMVMGVGSGHATGMRWPHPTVSLSTEFVRGARLGQWLEGTARIARRTVNFCFASCDLVCGGEIVLVATGVFKVPDVAKIPEAMRAKALGKFES